MSREQEIRDAIKTIQRAINDRMLFGPESWDRKKNILTRLVISGTGIHTVSYDPDGGRDMGNGFSEGSTSISSPTSITIEDPSVAITLERDRAAAELAQIQGDLESTAKKKAEAQRRLDEINNRLLASIK